MAIERELTAPIDLCAPAGRLNPAAKGWSRRADIRANLGRWGRRKRWEYWAVQSPDAVLAVTISDLDYAGLSAVWFLDSAHTERGATALTPLARLPMPETAGGGPVTVSTKALSISLRPDSGGVHLRARTADLDADIRIERPAGHESMGVVVPWSATRFQYTVKENTLPARGTVSYSGQTHTFGDDSWATWDFGRGKWPYRITWNWGSASGLVGGRVVGLQFGGKWTDGTGATENSITLDGLVHKISAPVSWAYDPSDWTAPWRLRNSDVDVTFTPTYVRTDTTNLGVLANETHQCFGWWSGTVRVAGETVAIDGLRGWAEEVRNRW